MKTLIKILLIAYVVVGSIFLGNTANAVSAYDDLIETTDTLQLTDMDNWDYDTYTDYTYIWYSELVDSLLYQCNERPAGSLKTEYCNSYQFAKDFNFQAGNVIVTQGTAPAGNTAINIFLTNDLFAEIYFNDSSGQTKLSMDTDATSTYYQFMLQHYPSHQYANDNGTLESYNGLLPNNHTIGIINMAYHEYPESHGFTKIFNSTFYFNQPPDYEGEIPPFELPTIVEDNKATPDIDYSQEDEFNVQIFDRNFFTFDNNPFLCDGLAPVIDWSISDDETNILDEVTLSATGTYTYQFEKNYQASEYTIAGKYRCATYDFTETSYRTVEFMQTGALKPKNPFKDCFQDDFPFIDLNVCGDNIISLFTKGLNIDTDIFDDEWQSNSGCRQLVVVGNWLHLENKTVCPFFSETIRNIATPFVTFILGLLIFKWISNVKSRGDL